MEIGDRWAAMDRWADVPSLVGRRRSWDGFRGASARQPPGWWETDHRMAETGGYSRQGRYWRPTTTRDTVLPIASMPVRVLYRALIDRVSLQALIAQGYTIDS